MIFMGSDSIALPGLEGIVSGRCGDIEVVAVYTQPDRPRGRGKKVVPNEIKTWALEKGLPVYQPEKVGKAERLEIESMNVDSILVMAYGHILSQRLIDTPRLGIWNLHTSILPKYRGASPIQCAIASGDQTTGVTLMKLVREMDAGPILDVEKVGIGKENTALDVEACLAAACVPLLERGLPLIHEGQPDLQEQDTKKATFVRKLTKEDGELDFRKPARELACRINGLYPWPATRAVLADTAIKIGLAVASTETFGGEPGVVVGIEKDGLRVVCGEGSLLLKRLQRPGGKMLSAADFVRGFELPTDAVFESREMSELVSTEHKKS